MTRFHDTPPQCQEESSGHSQKQSDDTDFPLADFAAHLKCLSEATRRAYLADWRTLNEYLQRLGIPWTQVKRVTLEDLIVELIARKYKHSSIDRKLSAWRNAFDWLKLHGYIDRSPMEGIRNVGKSQSKHRRPTYLKESELSLFLNTPIKPYIYRQGWENLHLRDQVAFLLLAETGLPLERLFDLRVADIDLERGVLRCRK